jgi:hypothetical protein
MKTKKEKKRNRQNISNKVRNITLFGDLSYSFITDSETFHEASSDYPDNAYTGRTTGTVYSGGADYTDWNTSILVSKDDIKKGFKKTSFGNITLNLNK